MGVADSGIYYVVVDKDMMAGHSNQQQEGDILLVGDFNTAAASAIKWQFTAP